MVGKIVTVGSSKGGGGKTVLACCLAPNLVAHGYKVGVIDADPNGTFAAWYAAYSGPAFRCQAEVGDVAVVDLGQAWATDLDVVIIDTAGFSNLTAAAAMGAADHVLVPCMADRGSTREAAKTVAKVASLARAARGDIPASVVLSQWRSSGIAERAAVEDLMDFGVTSILKAALPERAAFRQMSFDSRAIVSGVLGMVVDRLIAELVELGALEEISVLEKLPDLAELT
jgi:chromosome partitioning protein